MTKLDAVDPDVVTDTEKPLTELDAGVVKTTDTEKSTGSYIQDQIMSILFPILALWYGPKYLVKGEYPKGVVILIIFAIELYFIISYNS